MDTRPDSSAAQKACQPASVTVAPDAATGRKSLIPETNWKCAWGFGVFVGSASALGIAFILIMLRTAPMVAAVFLMIAAPTMIWALLLAVLGFRECLRNPERYQRGRARGLVTLILGSIAACFLLFIIAGAITGMRESPAIRNRTVGNRSELLKFSSMNFVLQSPGPPWGQADARIFGRAPVVAFMRPGPMYFTVSAARLPSEFPNAQQRFVDLCRSNDQSQVNSYHLVSAIEFRRNDLNGWQTENDGNFQGHDYFFVHWILATNGFGYKLSAWAPPDAASQLKEEAEHLFSGFQVSNARRPQL